MLNTHHFGEITQDVEAMFGVYFTTQKQALGHSGKSQVDCLPPHFRRRHL